MTIDSELSRGNVRRFRAIWISDVHLGTISSKTGPLLDFLRQHECETLYLVGDIIDIWRLQHRWYWPESHSEVLARIADKTRHGTRVTYIPGNHDDALRQWVGTTVGGIEFHRDFMHTTADGKRLLVIHGDEFHGVMKKTGEDHLADRVFDAMIAIDARLNRVCRRTRLPYKSLSSFVKRTAKSISTLVTHYVKDVTAEAVRRGADGVICGHNHQPKAIQSPGFLYCNDGDWVESCTALVETFDGQLFLAKRNAEGWAYSPVRMARKGSHSRRRIIRPVIGKCRAAARRVKSSVSALRRRRK